MHSQPARQGRDDELRQHALDLERARGNGLQAWHLPTASPAPSARELLALSARLLGAPDSVRQIPPTWIRLASAFVPTLREVSEMLYQFRQDYVFSSARFEGRYPDFRITPYDEGVAATIAALRADPGQAK